MESSNQKVGKFEKSKHGSLKLHISFRVMINVHFLVCQYLPIILFEGQKTTLLLGPFLKQKIKSDSSELLAQKITSDGSKLRRMAEPGLAGVPVLSPVTPWEVSPASLRDASPRPAEGCSLSCPGCCSPGIREGFPPRLCCFFTFSVCLRWNNRSMAFILQHREN